MPHVPKEDFQKVKILSFFKKGGLRGSKNIYFFFIFPKSKSASKKLGTKHLHMPSMSIFKKSQNFEFFQERGVKGVKNWVLYMCHMPPKKIFKKSQNFESFQKRGAKGVKK